MNVKEIRNIETYELTGYLLDDMSVPLAEGNRHYHQIQEWIAEGNTPEPAFEDWLSLYKDLKVSKVNGIRDSKMLSFTYEGVEYQTRPTDRENILGQALEISLGNENDVLWITADNTITTFAAQEFVAFAKAVSDQKRQCIFNARQMKDAILAATSKEEVDAVEWNDEA